MARDETGAAAVQFALAVVVLLLLTLGAIDFGRATFDWNAAQKAAQIGVQEAITRDPIVLPIKYHYQCNAPASYTPAVAPGDLCSTTAVKEAGACDFGVFTCTSAGCTGPNGAVGATLLAPGAFDTIVAAMRSALPRLEASNVSIIYRPTDLGFVGMPTAPVAEVTVEIADMPFDFVGLAPMTALSDALAMDTDIVIPTIRATLTAEDMSDNSCAEQGLAEETSGGTTTCTKPGNNPPTFDPVCF